MAAAGLGPHLFLASQIAGNMSYADSVRGFYLRPLSGLSDPSDRHLYEQQVKAAQIGRMTVPDQLRHRRAEF